jgi:hypothetical protein
MPKSPSSEVKRRMTSPRVHSAFSIIAAQPPISAHGLAPARYILAAPPSAPAPLEILTALRDQSARWSYTTSPCCCKKRWHDMQQTSTSARSFIASKSENGITVIILAPDHPAMRQPLAPCPGNFCRARHRLVCRPCSKFLCGIYLLWLGRICCLSP